MAASFSASGIAPGAFEYAYPPLYYALNKITLCGVDVRLDGS